MLRGFLAGVVKVFKGLGRISERLNTALCLSRVTLPDSLNDECQRCGDETPGLFEESPQCGEETARLLDECLRLVEQHQQLTGESGMLVDSHGH